MLGYATYLLESQQIYKMYIDNIEQESRIATMTQQFWVGYSYQLQIAKNSGKGGGMGEVTFGTVAGELTGKACTSTQKEERLRQPELTFIEHQKTVAQRLEIECEVIWSH